MTAEAIAIAAGALGAAFLAGLLCGLRVGFKLWRQTFIELRPKGTPIGKF